MPWVAVQLHMRMGQAAHAHQPRPVEEGARPLAGAFHIETCIKVLF